MSFDQELAEFMVRRFKAQVSCVKGKEVQVPKAPPKLIEKWGEQFVADCVRAVTILVQAYFTPSACPFPSYLQR